MTIRERFVNYAAYFVVALTVSGFFIGVIWHGPITGLLFPLGLTFWWLLYRFVLYDES